MRPASRTCWKITRNFEECRTPCSCFLQRRGRCMEKTLRAGWYWSCIHSYRLEASCCNGCLCHGTWQACSHRSSCRYDIGWNLAVNQHFWKDPQALYAARKLCIWLLWTDFFKYGTTGRIRRSASCRRFIYPQPGRFLAWILEQLANGL